MRGRTAADCCRRQSGHSPPRQSTPLSPSTLSWQRQHPPLPPRLLFLRLSHSRWKTTSSLGATAVAVAPPSTSQLRWFKQQHQQTLPLSDLTEFNNRFIGIRCVATMLYCRCVRTIETEKVFFYRPLIGPR